MATLKDLRAMIEGKSDDLIVEISLVDPKFNFALTEPAPIEVEPAEAAEVTAEVKPE
jgi:hypothetical protein